MEVIGIKTRVLDPPKDSLFEVLEESLKDIQEKDSVLISSKIMAIHQGRCIAREKASIQQLIHQESDRILSYHNTALGRSFGITLKNNTLVSAGGVDQSNGNGYFILWPENIIEFCKEIRSYICNRFSVNEIAVIAVDSHSLPLRYGAVGVSIGYYGMRPLKNYQGKEDLFGRDFRVERSNLIDMLASAGTLVMGEGREQTPIALIRDVGDIEFVDYDTSDEFYVPIEQDMFWPLLKILKKK